MIFIVVMGIDGLIFHGINNGLVILICSDECVHVNVILRPGVCVAPKVQMPFKHV